MKTLKELRETTDANLSENLWIKIERQYKKLPANKYFSHRLRNAIEIVMNENETDINDEIALHILIGDAETIDWNRMNKGA